MARRDERSAAAVTAPVRGTRASLLAQPTDPRALDLRAYRIVALVVGVGLIILVFVGLPLQFAAHNKLVVEIVGPIHGFLYIGYLLLALNLAFRERWNPLFALPVLLAGTVPGLSFVAERVVTKKVTRERLTRAQPVVSAGPEPRRPPPPLRQR